MYSVNKFWGIDILPSGADDAFYEVLFDTGCSFVIFAINCVLRKGLVCYRFMLFVVS